jgi:hypothetical protein
MVFLEESKPGGIRMSDPGFHVFLMPCNVPVIIIIILKTWMQFGLCGLWTRVKHVGVGGTERATNSEKGLAVNLNAPCLFSVFCRP